MTLDYTEIMACCHLNQFFILPTPNLTPTQGVILSFSFDKPCLPLCNATTSSMRSHLVLKLSFPIDYVAEWGTFVFSQNWHTRPPILGCTSRWKSTNLPYQFPWVSQLPSVALQLFDLEIAAMMDLNWSWKSNDLMRVLEHMLPSYMFWGTCHPQTSHRPLLLGPNPKVTPRCKSRPNMAQ